MYVVGVILLSVMFFSCQTEDDTIINENIEASTRRMSPPPGLCGYEHYVADTTTGTQWDDGVSATSFIDDRLERMFGTSCYFTYRCIRPNGPATAQYNGEVEFTETSFNGVFNTLKSDISVGETNSLKGVFSCRVTEYRNDNHPGAIISDVTFSRETTSTGLSTTRTVKAQFTMYIHG